MNGTSHSDITYYPIFDLLRFILALIVVLGHDHIFSDRFHLWSHSGNFAVQIFFALSGFLIGSILLKTSKEKLNRFYFNRAIRIWIPYFIALTLVVAASLLHDQITPKWIEIIIYKLSFVYNTFGPQQLDLFRNEMPLQGSSNHFWSVNAEEQFYLLAPLLLVLANKRWGQHVATWVILAIAAWYTQTYASIVLGVLSVVLVKHYGEYYKKSSVKALLLLSCVLSFYAFYNEVFDYGLVAPISAISIVLLLAIKGEKNQLGAFLGGISYPLYLNHWIGVFVANIALRPLALEGSMYRVTLEVMLNLAIASTLFLMIEKPMLAKRNALYTRQRGTVICYIAYSMVIVGIIYGVFIAK